MRDLSVCLSQIGKEKSYLLAFNNVQHSFLGTGTIEAINGRTYLLVDKILCEVFVDH